MNGNGWPMSPDYIVRSGKLETVSEACLRGFHAKQSLSLSEHTVHPPVWVGDRDVGSVRFRRTQ
jgi:hypothetical protein